jgi:hypothetical protein
MCTHAYLILCMCDHILSQSQSKKPKLQCACKEMPSIQDTMIILHLLLWTNISSWSTYYFNLLYLGPPIISIYYILVHLIYLLFVSVSSGLWSCLIVVCFMCRELSLLVRSRLLCASFFLESLPSTLCQKAPRPSQSTPALLKLAFFSVSSAHGCMVIRMMHEQLVLIIKSHVYVTGLCVCFFTY